MLDFALARSKHLNWKTKLRSFLDGGHALTETQALSHKDCELGKWLYSEGLGRYGHLTGMQELEQVHVELHAIVKKVVQLKNAGNATGAQQELIRLGPVSNKIIALLKDIEQRYEGSPRQTAK
jgi:methyl-accepting chemotaxis protein